eukprot:tig00020904_g15242.t1
MTKKTPSKGAGAGGHEPTPNLKPISAADVHAADFASIRSVLDAMEEVRTLLRNEPLKPPMIVVVGDQSTGKTSTLERLSGAELPRGEGIVTRCPLVLSLRGVAKGAKEYAKVLVPSKTDIEKKEIVLDEIDQTVRDFQDRIAGDSRGISKTEIALSIFKEGATDLTLIDLPGLVQQAVDGQEASVPDDIRAMVRTYIKAPEAVILCILHAGLDPETSEALRIAREFDPDGERTAVVLTKVDEFSGDLGSRVKRILEGRSVSVGLGLVMLRNRKQSELQERMTAEQANLQERKYFENREDIREYYESFQRICGVDALRNLLCVIQHDRIAKLLPKLQHDVIERLHSQREILESMPISVAGNHSAAAVEFMRLVSSFCRTVESLLQGGLDPDLHDFNEAELRELYLSARMLERFESMSEQIRSAKSDFFSKEFEAKVQFALRDSRGASLPNFISMPAFVKLFRAEIEGFKKPIYNCLADVKGLLENALLKIAHAKFKCYPDLEMRAASLLQAKLHDWSAQAKRELVDLLLQEETEPFTLNDYYDRTLQEIQAQMTAEREKRRQEAEQGVLQRITNFFKIREADGDELSVSDAALTPSQQSDVLAMQFSLSSYWKVVFKRCCDFVCMRLRLRLSRPLITELIGSLSALKDKDEGALMELMAEPAATQRERAKLEQSVESLEKARAILAKLPATRPAPAPPASAA